MKNQINMTLLSETNGALITDLPEWKFLNRHVKNSA